MHKPRDFYRLMKEAAGVRKKQPQPVRMQQSAAVGGGLTSTEEADRVSMVLYQSVSRADPLDTRYEPLHRIITRRAALAAAQTGKACSSPTTSC